MSETPSIRIRSDGPYVVTGIDLLRVRADRDGDGRPVRWQEHGDIDHEAAYVLCRCGSSKRKPFCDGSHREIGFDGTETGPRSSTAEQRDSYGSDERVMTDHEEICAHAGFCSRAGTHAWKLARRKELPDDERQLLADMTRDCPSGRLVLHEPPDARGLERDLPQRICVVDDGPLYVQGGVPLEGAQGPYEPRNRMTLCRCGASGNKPFCDGSHADAGFRDS